MKRRSLGESFAAAMDGVGQVLRTERNMKIHLLAATLAVLAGWFCKISRVEWGILVLTIFLVLVTETINTAIEKSIDLITPAYHPLAGLAKNMAAGAVLLAAVSAVIIAFIIFAPRLGGIFG
jgi:diacylglycerol kinase